MVFAKKMLLGVAKSCGCLKFENKGRKISHGMTNSREWVSWRSMRMRCGDSDATSYKYYGERGVKIDPRWDDFENFYQDLGPRPPGHSLDRIDNNGPYSPENCRWATPLEQTRNRRSSRWAEVGGVRRPLVEWAKDLGMSTAALYDRIKSGWDVVEAVTTPKTNRWKRASR